ncbi:MAG: coproporphyrinogen III oxidase family protein, partial [Lachnospiraceae bacterium]|nr:coproporphyrinogen III oxidase family protein [Lachnospiraceae bacterium]
QPDYALPGHANRQIIDLWGAPQKYNLGFGAGAFSESFNGCSWANIHDPKQYISSMEKDEVPILMGRVWSEDDAIARYMALGVRMLKVMLKPFAERFGLRADEIYKYEIQKLKELGYVELNKDILLITEKGRYYIDNISKTFFNLANRGRSQYWGCKLREYMPERFYTWDVVCGGKTYGD